MPNVRGQRGSSRISGVMVASRSSGVEQGPDPVVGDLEIANAITPQRSIARRASGAASYDGVAGAER